MPKQRTPLEEKLHSLQKSHDWSEEEWEKQLNRAPDPKTRVALLLQLAYSQQQQGLHQLSQDTYTRIAEDNSQDPLAQLGLIKLFLTKRDLIEAEHLLDIAIKRFPAEESFEILRLRLLFQKQNLRTTHIAAQAALKKFPKNEALHLICVVNAMTTNDQRFALTNALSGVTACPNSAMAHTMYAVTLMGNSFLHLAKIEAAKALLLDRKCLPAAMVLASIYDRQNNTKEAAATMKRIMMLMEHNRMFVIQYVRYLIRIQQEQDAVAPLLMVAANDILDAARSSQDHKSDPDSLGQATIQRSIQSYIIFGQKPIRQYLSLESQALRSDLLRMFSHLPTSSIRAALKQLNDYPGTPQSHALARIIAGDVLWLLHRDKLATSCYESAATGKLPLRIAANSFSRFLLDNMNNPEAAVVWWQKASSYPSLSKQAQFNITILKRNIANRHNDIAGRIKSKQKALLRMFEFGSTDELLSPDSGPMRHLKRECVDESIK